MKLRQIASTQALALLAASFLLSLGAPNLHSQEEVASESAAKPTAVEKVADATAEADEKSETTAESSDEENAPKTDETSDSPIVALVGGTIMTCDTAGVIENGIILIQDQKILAVGDKSLEIPASAEQMNISGMVVTPGLIDTQSTIWLEPGSRSAYASDAGLRVTDGLDPFDQNWESVLNQGVTAAYIQPSSSGFLGGPGAVVSTFPKSATEVEVMNSAVSIQMALGVRSSDNRSRKSEIDRVKKVFDGVKEYQKKWEAYRKYEAEQKKKEAAGKKAEAADKESKTKEAKPDSEKGGDQEVKKPAVETPSRGRTDATRSQGRPAANGSAEEKKDDESKGTDKKSEEKPAGEKDKKAPEKPELDENKELLIKVLEGEIPLRLEIQNADDFFYAKELFENELFEKVQIVYQGLSDLGSAAEDFAQQRLPVVIGPWLSLGGPDAAVDLRKTDWATKFGDYAGTLAISSGGATPADTRQLRAHAASAIASGVPADRVLKAVTCDAAKLLGLGDMIGSITAGKRADLVCFEGAPLNTATSVQIVVIAGKIVVDQRVGETAESLAGLSQNASPVLDLPSAFPGSFAIRSSRVWQTGTFEPKTLLIKNGKIEAVESMDFEVAEGMPIFDLGEHPITPGLFSAHATLGISGAVDPSNLVDASYVTSSVALSNAEDRMRNLVAKGLLAAIVAPGNSNPIAGQGNLVRLSSPAVVTVENAATKFVVANDARSTSRFPSSLAGQSQLISQSLQGSPIESNIYLPASVNARLAAASQEVAKSLTSGRRLAMFVAETDAEAMAALDLIERFKLRAAITGLQQIAPFLNRLKALNVALVIQPIQTDAYEWYAEDISAAAEAGIAIYFAGESAEQLRFSAASAIQAGMPAEAALNAICNPSRLVGTDTEAPLTAGSIADMVVWSNSPTDLSATPLRVIVNGKPVSEKDE